MRNAENHRLVASMVLFITVCVMTTLVLFAADTEKKYSVATIQSVEKISPPAKMQGSDPPLAADAEVAQG